uniref:GBF-interacting protein 1 N-terminal domain-containing protein n=2 Tax=Oryza brachyantha TaxID=4533 RepID=J3LPQ1_ORYBR
MRQNTSHQGPNDHRVQKEMQAEWARPGRVLNRNTNRGSYFRNSLPGVTKEFRVVKDNRQKVVGETIPESFHNEDPSDEQNTSNSGDKSSTEKLPAQRHLVTQSPSGRGAAQAGNGCNSAAQAHDKMVKPSNDQTVGQSDGMIATMVGSHAVLGKGNQNRVLAVPSGTNNFTGELCCSSSDPIHVPSPGSRSAGTFGAIKREVGVVGARQRPSDNATTNTSTSNSSVKMPVNTGAKDNASNGQQSRFSVVSLKNSRPTSSTHLSSRPPSSSQYHSKPNTPVGHPKVNPQLEWKPKSVSPRPVNHLDNVAHSSAASSVDGNQADVAGLSKKLSQVANTSEDEHVIIPAHLRVPDSEIKHLIFGNFECDVESKAFPLTPDASANREFNAHSRSTDDVPPTEQTDVVGSCGMLPTSDSVVSEHQHPLTEDVEVLIPGVIGEHKINEMISTQVSHSSPQPQHQDSSAVHDFKEYEPDSRYELSFITKSVDSEAAQIIPYPSEVTSLHAANFNQLSIPVSTPQPVPQMYQQHMHVPQYPNCLPYRHVFSPYYGPPMAVQNYSSNPAFSQLPNASNYLVMPNGTTQLAPNGMKYGQPHQCKQVFPGGPAGYGGFPNQNGYPVNTGVIGGTGTVEDANMGKYKDTNLYALNPQAEAGDVWIQAPSDIPVMPPTPFYNMMGQPVSPHTAYLPAHSGHAPFSPVQHPAHLQFPAMPHGIQPTTMTMVQNPQPMVHQPAGNISIDMAAMASGAQVGAFQQNQLSHLGWAPPNF